MSFKSALALIILLLFGGLPSLPALLCLQGPHLLLSLAHRTLPKRWWEMGNNLGAEGLDREHLVPAEQPWSVRAPRGRGGGGRGQKAMRKK